MIETGKKQEKVILVAAATEEIEKAERSLDELGELVKTAGAEVCGRMIQARDMIHTGTYIGSGKLDELKWLVWEKEADGIVCDDELSPVQLKNLEEALDCKIMDRTLVILDIFAASVHKRGEDPGGAGTAKIPAVPSDRPGKESFQAWRRYRDERAGRKETGDGQKTY